MVVYSSCQCPENAQGVIAKCLGIPEHNVRVITRRVGGGFGGKALKALPVSIDVYGFHQRFSSVILLLFTSEQNFLTFSLLKTSSSLRDVPFGSCPFWNGESFVLILATFEILLEWNFLSDQLGGDKRNASAAHRNDMKGCLAFVT